MSPNSSLISVPQDRAEHDHLAVAGPVLIFSLFFFFGPHQIAYGIS